MEQSPLVLASGGGEQVTAGGRAQCRLRVVPDLAGRGGDGEGSCLERAARMLEVEEARLPAGSVWRLTFRAWISALDGALRLRP